jgi:hypothetical protein
LPGQCGTLLRVRLTEVLGIREMREKAESMFWMLPQLELAAKMGKPEAHLICSFRPP